MIPFFTDPEIQDSFEINGYVIMDVFNLNTIEKIRQLYLTIGNNPGLPFHSTLHNPDINYRRKVSDALTDMIGKQVKSIFISPNIITCSFVVKEPHKQSHVIIHQDWNLTQEDLFPGINMWFPLTNTTDENGSLYLLPGSHKIRKTIRGTNAPDPFSTCDNLQLSKLKKIELNVGQVVIYDVRMLHGSPPNLSSQTRIACAIGVIPNGATMIHFRFNPETKQFTEYKIDADFFLNYQNDDTFFEALPVIQQQSPLDPIKPEELKKLLHEKQKDNIFKRIFTSIKGK